MQNFKDSDWFALVKATRKELGVSIDDAHRHILSDPKMRRWVTLRVNSSQSCRKMALFNIRHNGEASLFELHGTRLALRD